MIQIAKYPHMPLPEVSDAVDLASVLCDPVRCGYSIAHVRIIQDREATRAGLIAEIRRLVANADEESTVVFYFSGHGGQSGEIAYLLPFDVDTASLADTALSTADLARELSALRARKVLLIFDCCHSGGLEARDVEPAMPVRPGLPAAAQDALLQGRGWALFASSDLDERSYVRPGERNGIFTKHFLGGLLREQSGDAHVRVFDLFTYLQPRVERDEPRQHPVFKCAVQHNFAIARNLAGTSELVGGDGQLDTDIVARGTQDILGRAIAAVPAMRYAMGVGGLAAVVSLVLVGLSLSPVTAVVGGLFVLAFMVVLVVFSRLAASSSQLKLLSSVLAWAFSLTALVSTMLFGSCFFFDAPKSMPCLLVNKCGQLVSSSTSFNEYLAYIRSKTLQPPVVPAASNSSRAIDRTSTADGGQLKNVTTISSPTITGSFFTSFTTGDVTVNQAPESTSTKAK